MKKIIAFMLLLVYMVAAQSAFAAETVKLENDSCTKFTENLYMAKDTWLRTAAGYSNRDDLQTQSDIATRQVKRLHVILEKEGFTIAKKEKSDIQFGKTTAIAVAGLQNKYKSELLTSQNLTYSYGVLDGKGVEFLNQKYGCIEKAKITLPQEGKTIDAQVGEAMKTPYVIAGVPASTKLKLVYTNALSVANTIEQTPVRNGKSEITWNAPATVGTYTVRVSLDGATDVGQFVLRVISTEQKDYTVVSPVANTEVSQNENIKVKINGTFARSERGGTAIVEVQNTTSNAKTVLATNRKISDLLKGANVKIPKDLPTGSYKVLVTYSTSLGSFVKESGVIVVKSSVTSGSSTGNTAGSGSNTNTSGDTTGSTGSTTDRPVLTLKIPKTYSSVVAGKPINVRGTIPGVPNSTKVKMYLKGANGEVFVKEASVFSCPTPGGSCYGIKSPLGMTFAIPATTAAGTYTLRGEVILKNGTVVQDESDSFTVTAR